MKKFFFILCLAVGAFKLYSIHHAKTVHLAPLQQQPYIVVYGRETCGNCQELKSQLTRKGIKFFSKDIDNAMVAAEIHARMTVRGIDTSSYILPVVDVNTQIQTHPSVEWVLAKYKSYPAR